jgi:endonuclease G
MQQQLTLVCYLGYASANSAITRTPIWSAEHLTAGRIDTARATQCVSKFFAEPSLDPAARSELDDYRRSGFDRGHLSPAGDMPGLDQQRQSFSLANIAPQNPELNRGPWADLEGQVRDLAQSSGDVWVVTGVLLEGTQINTTPDGRVLVPTAFWKAVMIPGRGAVVFIANNSGGGAIDHASLQVFQHRSGMLRQVAGGVDERAGELKGQRQTMVTHVEVERFGVFALDAFAAPFPDRGGKVRTPVINGATRRPASPD